MLIAIVSGPEGGRISECDEQPIVLGRRGTLQLADRKVSKRHARLRCDGGDWYIEDMGSTNGTYVNGDRVDRPRRVSEGDKLELGATVMVISKLAGAPLEPDPTPIDDPSPASTQAVEDSPALTQSVDDSLPATQSGRDSLAAMQDGADPLAAWTITLAQRGEPERALAAPAPDDAVLSIRPLAHHEPPVVPAWRRIFPYLILTLVLFAVVANIVLVILFRRDARADVRALRAALEQREQVTAEMIVQEVREELRSPSPQQLHALKELHDGLAAKQEMFNETLREELAARDEQRSREAAAREQDRSRRETDESQAAIARALEAMKQDIVRLQTSASSPAALQPAGASAETASAAATIASVPVAAVKDAVDQAFLIDASAGLERAIPVAAAEVRRALREAPRQGRARVLLLYQGRLMELQPAALGSADGAEAIDHGPADLPKALTMALADRPRALHLLSDTLGDLPATLRIIRESDTTGTSIHVTQFFSRNHREELKALAREYHGTYTFIAPAG